MRLIGENVYKAFMKDGIQMLSDRRIEVVREEGVEGRRGTHKVKRLFVKS